MKDFDPAWGGLFLAGSSGEGGWRSYRSEIDIVLNILRVVASAEPYGVKKTRLMQLSNLNSQTAAKYLGFLESVGLLESRGGAYRLKPRGFLAMLLIDMYRSLVSPQLASGDGYARLREALETAAESIGARIDYNAYFYDARVELERARIGVIFVDSCDERCRRGLAGLLSEVARSTVDSNLIVILDSGGGKALERRRGLVMLWVPKNNIDPEALAEALKAAADDRPASRGGMVA